MLALLACAAALGAEISGTWTMEVETAMGSGTPTFVLKQQGDKLTGTYSGALGEKSVTGSVKADQVTIEFDADQVNGKVIYTGTLDAAAKKVKGKVKFGDAGEGTFTGSKKE